MTAQAEVKRWRTGRIMTLSALACGFAIWLVSWVAAIAPPVSELLVATDVESAPGGALLFGFGVKSLVLIRPMLSLALTRVAGGPAPRSTTDWQHLQGETMQAPESLKKVWHAVF